VGLKQVPRVRLGTVSLGSRPVVAAVCSDGEILSPDPAALSGAEVLELRVDRFTKTTPRYTTEMTERALATGRGVLVTVRAEAEGGERPLGVDARRDLYRAASAAHAFDLEIASSGLWESVKGIEGAATRLLIGSFHDFVKTPSREDLEEIWTRGCERGANVVKIACRISDADELRRLAAFTLDHAADGIITLGMGDWGPFSRLLLPGLGSLLSYGFVASAVAPGQLSVGELAREFDRWYPRMSAS